ADEPTPRGAAGATDGGAVVPDSGDAASAGSVGAPGARTDRGGRTRRRARGRARRVDRPASQPEASDRNTRMIGGIVDTVLDRTVVGGYTNVGFRIRSRGWSPSELEPMDGKVVAVTGASSGLGLAAAEG